METLYQSELGMVPNVQIQMEYMKSRLLKVMDQALLFKVMVE